MSNNSPKAVLTFRDDEEKKMLEAEASNMKLPLSAYLRLVILGIIHRGDSQPKDITK